MALRDNLISWWELDEASGTRVDSHGSIDLSDINTVTQAAGGGPDGSDVADFEVTNKENLANTNATALDFGHEDFSAVFWVEYESFPAASNRALFSMYDSGTSTLKYVLFNRSSDDHFRWAVRNESASTFDAVATTFGAASLSTWYMVYVYHDAAADELGISVNDGTIDTGTGPTSIETITNAEFRVGAWEPDGGTVEAFHDGLMCKGAMYSRVLTPSEVTELYNSGSGLTYAATAPRRIFIIS